MIESIILVGLAAYVPTGYGHALAAPAPTITPAPVLARQATSTGFVGYYSTGLSWDVAECVEGRTFTTAGTYGICCPTTMSCSRNDIATGCSGAYALYPTGPYSCSYTCNTDWVRRSTDDANPTLWIGCDSDATQTNFYRSKPSAAVVSQSSTSPRPNSATPSTPSRASSPSTVTVAGGLNTSPPEPTPTPTLPTPSVKKSKAWIAGVVVGPLAVIAIVGLLAWIFCLKKKKKTESQQPQQPYVPGPQMAGVQQPSGAYMQQPQPGDPRYSTLPEYTNAPYQQAQSPPPQQWAPAPGQQTTSLVPGVAGHFAPDKYPLTQEQQQQQQFLDAKSHGPSPNVSEVPSPQTQFSNPIDPSQSVSEVGSPSPQSAPGTVQQSPHQSYAPTVQSSPNPHQSYQAGPVQTHLPNSASELQ